MVGWCWLGQTCCVTFETESAAETEEAGAELARRLVPGDVVLIEGDLGTGKTTFVRGACRELGVEGVVTSPTFTIGQVYAGRVEVAHLDLYRLESLEGEDPSLIEDYLTPERIGFVEWPAVGEAVVTEVVARVRLAHAGGDRRRVEIE
jgi:tRNA threonylcarbamoyladenosine biosynthesis protein TsaE